MENEVWLLKRLLIHAKTIGAIEGVLYCCSDPLTVKNIKGAVKKMDEELEEVDNKEEG